MAKVDHGRLLGIGGAAMVGIVSVGPSFAHPQHQPPVTAPADEAAARERDRNTNQQLLRQLEQRRAEAVARSQRSAEASRTAIEFLDRQIKIVRDQIPYEAPGN